MPGEREDIPCYGLQNFRIDRVGGVGGLMKVRVDPAAHDGDGWNSCLFERYVVAAGEESVQVKLVYQTHCLPCFLYRGFFKLCDTDG